MNWKTVGRSEQGDRGTFTWRDFFFRWAALRVTLSKNEKQQSFRYAHGERLTKYEVSIVRTSLRPLDLHLSLTAWLPESLCVWLAKFAPPRNHVNCFPHLSTMSTVSPTPAHTRIFSPDPPHIYTHTSRPTENTRRSDLLSLMLPGDFQRVRYTRLLTNRMANSPVTPQPPSYPTTYTDENDTYGRGGLNLSVVLI